MWTFLSTGADFKLPALVNEGEGVKVAELESFSCLRSTGFCATGVATAATTGVATGATTGVATGVTGAEVLTGVFSCFFAGGTYLGSTEFLITAPYKSSSSISISKPPH